MKRILFRILYVLGFPAVFRYLHRRSLTVVLYHGVAPALVQGIYNYRGKNIVPAHFEEHLQYFKKHYTVLPLERALVLLAEGTLPPRTLVITFDDGYKNFADFAFPLLRKYQMPATMFVATDFVFKQMPLWVDRLEYAISRDDGSHSEKTTLDTKERARLKGLTPAMREHDLRNIEQISFTQFHDFTGDREVYAPLTRELMLQMQFEGVSFGAHTRTHPILSKMTEEEQRYEIGGSRDDLSDQGFRVSSAFAYPNGQQSDWNDVSEKLLSDSGMTHALTTVAGFNTAETHPYRLRRIVLDGSNDFAVFANIVSGVRLFLKSVL